MRLRDKAAVHVAGIAQGIWDWADLDRNRPLTECDLIIINIVARLDDLADRLFRP